MSQKLSFENFRWIDCPEYINLDSYDENSAKVLILEVDLEYPEELHHLHNDYPCAPEKNICSERNALRSLPRNSGKRKDVNWWPT